MSYLPCFSFNLVIMSGEYICDAQGCNRSFNSALGLQGHKRVHSDNWKEKKATDCPQCGQTFPTKVGCNVHITLKHRREFYHPPTTSTSTSRIKVQPVLCPICGMIIMSNDFESHKINYHPT